MPIGRVTAYLTFDFFAEPPAAFPFGFVSLVSAFFRFRPVLAGIGVVEVAVFFAFGVVVVTLRDVVKKFSSRPC